MNTLNEKHMESVTVKNFTEWQKDAFVLYASSTNSGKPVELGVNGFGKYCVRYRTILGMITEVCTTKKKAIERYAEFLQ